MSLTVYLGIDVGSVTTKLALVDENGKYVDSYMLRTAGKPVLAVQTGLKELYKNEIVDAMTKKFGYKNVMEVPKLDKIVINMGVGEAKDNAKALESAVRDMEIISGQKAVLTKAKNSVANFKIREGMNIGCKVTLRGDKMYEFLDRLVNLALPRVRDFRGVNPNAFDGRGNYALGIKEQLIFPEIEYDKVDKVRGMDVIFVTTAKTDEEARELLRLFNMPFAK